MDKDKKNKSFTPPPPPVPTEDCFDDLFFGDDPLASTTEYTGMGKILPKQIIDDELL